MNKDLILLAGIVAVYLLMKNKATGNQNLGGHDTQGPHAQTAVPASRTVYDTMTI